MMKCYRKNKKLRFRNGHLKAIHTFYAQGMRYWAKDSMEAHKLLRLAKDEIKQLRIELNELKEKE